MVPQIRDLQRQLGMEEAGDGEDLSAALEALERALASKDRAWRAAIEEAEMSAGRQAEEEVGGKGICRFDCHGFRSTRRMSISRRDARLLSRSKWLPCKRSGRRSGKPWPLRLRWRWKEGAAVVTWLTTH